jgi:MoaA/NifB/PqqE/SkfB family radical SAM enzyme
MGSQAVTNSMWFDFLWLELTNRCNLQCVHCYSDSHPKSGYRDLLSREQYDQVIEDAFRLGCREVQLIGGEPQLSPHFNHVLRKAKNTGYEFIEVFSNLTLLSDEAINYAAENGIAFATSVYSDNPTAHDDITKSKSSHARTVRNLERLIARGVRTRAGVIAIDQSEDDINRTTGFLKSLGVHSVRVSGIREFGRAKEVTSQSAQLSGLCGQCWKGKLCVSPDGTAYPCVMAREWPVGNILNEELSQIVQGQPLDRMRRVIREQLRIPRSRYTPETECSPGVCSPDAICIPDRYPPPARDYYPNQSAPERG